MKKQKNQWVWVKHAVTDRDNTTYDGGRLALFYLVFGIVTFVIVVMCGLQGWDTIVNKQPFKPNDLGIGVGGLLGGIAGVLMGLGAYLYGQDKGQTGTVVDVSTIGVTNGSAQEIQTHSVQISTQNTQAPCGQTGNTGATGDIVTDGQIG